MRCRQATDLMDKYLDNRLDAKAQALLEIHYDSCSKCSSMLAGKRSLMEAFEKDCSCVGVPLDFTQNVMNKVFDLEADRTKSRKMHDSQNNAITFKRLGFSMLMSAAVMLFCMSIPSLNVRDVSSFMNAEAGAIAQRTMQFTDSIYEMNDLITNIYRNFNNTVEKFKEV